MKSIVSISIFTVVFVSLLQAQQKPVDWRLLGQTKEANFYDVQRDFDEYWSTREPAKGTGYKVFKRWEANMAPRVYPTGDLSLPSTTYQNFMAWQKGNRQSRRMANQSSGGWRLVGPPSKPSGYDAGVGRIDVVRFHPKEPNTIFVCATDGGLWKSEDAGATWKTNTDYLSVIGCSDLVIHPVNTDTMYLATGSWEGGERRSIGVLKSTNGGVSWETTGLSWVATDNFKIRRLIMDPTDPDIMMVATDGGVFRTTDAWATTVTDPIATLGFPYNLDDLKFMPGNHNVLYATGSNTGTTEVCWKSTDNGVTWSALTSGLPVAADVSRVLVNTTADDPNYVYLLAGNTDNAYLGLYRSTNGGTTFTTMSTSPNILSSELDASGNTGQANHDLALLISPTNKDSVTVGGINIWQSADGGATWTIRSYWLGDDPSFPNRPQLGVAYIHADIQSLTYYPGSSRRMYASCDGGVSVSMDGGLSWTDISNNLSVSQMYTLGLSTANPYFIIAGLQDIGSLRDSSASWSVINGGDGADGFIDRTRDSVLITSTPEGSYCLSLDYGKVCYDIPISATSPTGLPAGELFVSPIVQDPVDANTIYAGGRDTLYKSVEVLATFPTEFGVWTRQGKPSGTGGIIHLAIAPSDNQVIYTIKEDAVSKTINGGATWTDISSGLPVGTVMPTCITVSNTDQDKVWVTFSGYDSGSKVYKSIDGGSTWINVSTGLPNLPINTIVYTNNDANDAVYIGADIGVYYMDNTITSWESFNNNLANTKITDLEIYYPLNRLRAATYGRSLWESDLYNPLTDCSSTVVNTSDSGVGSLRRTIECAAPGDTIAIDPSLTGQTIMLTSGPITISKELYIIQTSSSKVTVGAAVNGPIFSVAGNSSFWVEHIDIQSGSNPTARALINNGLLTLKDVNIIENTPLGTSTISNLGKVTILGNVHVVVN